MNDFQPFLTPAQKRFLQRLRTDACRPFPEAGAAPSERMLTTMTANGWIVCRGEGPEREVRLTPSGLEALRRK